MSSSGHKNIIFEQVDLLNLPKHCSEVADSISCLHVIEHIGLGRYGDSLDPNGHIAAFKSLIKLLKKDGMLYVSFPIANSNKIYFNAHRVFESRELFNWIDPDSDIRLERFDYVDDEGNLQLNASLDFNGKKLSYGCGIYSLRKIS
jgi:hypothetical protein